MNFIRAIIFIPIAFILIGLIGLGFDWLFAWYLRYTWFWQILIFAVAFWSIAALFKTVSAILIALTSFIAPKGSFAFWTVAILAALNSIGLIIQIWACRDDFDYWSTFPAILFTLLAVELAYMLSIGAATRAKHD